MKRMMSFVGAAMTCAAILSQVNLADARCTGPIGATSSTCNAGGLNGTVTRSGTNATAQLQTGVSTINRQRDVNGDRVFCGAAQIAPRDTIAGAGQSASANLTGCITNGLGAVSVQALVD